MAGAEYSDCESEWPDTGYDNCRQTDCRGSFTLHSPNTSDEGIVVDADQPRHSSEQETVNTKSSMQSGSARPVATVARMQASQPQLDMPRYDPVNYILDKIDFEIYSAERNQAKQAQKSANQQAARQTAAAQRKSADGAGMPVDSENGDDTGLGTASVQGSEGGSELEDNGSTKYRDLDSDVAKQLDAQYKQILKKKSAEFVAGLARSNTVSELSSVATEQLLQRYKQFMVASLSESSYRGKSGATQPPQLYSLGQANTPARKQASRQKPGKPSVAMSDIDSILTEDIEREFRKTLVSAGSVSSRTDPSASRDKTGQKGLKGRGKAVARGSGGSSGGGRMPRFPANPLKTRGRARRGHHAGASDAESVRTEDFENHFHNVMVKQIGGVPITSFDQMIVDSDLDTVKSHIIREKLRQALGSQFGVPAEETEEEEEENYSTDDTEKFNTVIDARKLQQLLQPKSTPEAAPGRYESLEALHGSPRRDFRHLPSATPTNQFKFSTAATDEVDLGREEEELEQESARIRREIELEGRPAYKLNSSMGGGSALDTSVRSAAVEGKSSIISQLNPGYSQYGQASAPTQADQSQSLLDRSSAGSALDQSQVSLQQNHNERFQLQREHKALQQAVARGRLEIKSLEGQIKENRAKAEDARTEVMLAEFKRDSARKELETVLQQIHMQRSELRRIEEELEEEEEERADLSQQQLAEASAERDQLQERVRSLEAQLKQLAGREQELERQLADARETSSSQQAASAKEVDSLKQTIAANDAKIKELSDKQAALQREVERGAAQLAEVGAEREALRKKHDKLDTRFKQMENDKNQLIKYLTEEKSQEYDELKTRLTEQLTQARAHATQETHELRLQLATAAEQLAAAQAATNRKEEANLTLREQALSLQQQVVEAGERADAAREELHKQAAQLAAGKESALRQAEARLAGERADALARQAEELEERHSAALTDLTARYGAEARKLTAELGQKEVDLQVVRDQLKQQEAVTRQVGEKIRAEAQERFVKLMKEERGKWEQDKEAEVEARLARMREETEKTCARLRAELEEERSSADQKERHMSQLKQELEEEKESARALYREKLANLNQAKESVAREKERELDTMRERLEQETQRTVGRLRETVARQEEELVALREERSAAQAREKQAAGQHEQAERQLLAELAEEGRRNAHVLGRQPYTAYPQWTVGGGPVGAAGPGGRAQLQAALASVRAGNDELRKYVQELKYEVEAQKQSLSKLERQKSEAVEEQRRRMQQEKLAALESLKDRLIKEHLHEVDKLQASMSGRGGASDAGRSLRDKDKELRDIQSNMSAWKEQTSDKMVRKFQEELQREVDKRSKEQKRRESDWARERSALQREVARLERELQRGAPISTNQSTQRLQAQVRQLQAENLQIRRTKLGGGGGLSHSYTDLANTSLSEYKEGGVGAVVAGKACGELKSALENRARLAEERAHRNEALLNQKMSEVSKLQGTLTQQTKELMQLERAYTTLQQKGAVRPLTPKVSFAT